jgi:hypothetical protein
MIDDGRRKRSRHQAFFLARRLSTCSASSRS